MNESLDPETLPVSSSLEAIAHIGVGCFYQLDHSKLPPQAPDSLQSIRLVMVSMKALFKVSVRFPSMHSLQASLSQNGGDRNRFPELDEKYFLEPEAASEVLYRRVPPEEISERRRVWSFWAVLTRRRFESLVRNPLKKEWENRKRVRFLSPLRSPSPTPVSSEEIEIEGGEEEEEEAEANVVVVKNRRSERRKQPIRTQTKPKRPKCEEQSKQIVVHKSDKRMVKASAARWSSARYKMAEENMLNVLKAREASAANPVKRAALRSEARKLIGDTGLLDHLLKHMAGKVAPSGDDRFRRRHNADGAMEYWLESADLVEIRKEAGVEDPYWTPPQGWKPGDDPSQDPTCAKMFKEVWDEIDNLKKRGKETKRPEQGLAIATTAMNSLLETMDWDQAYTSVIQLKGKYTELAVRKSRLDEQMQQVSETLSGIEEEMNVLKSTTAPAAPLVHDSEAADVPQLTDNERVVKENKATKLERLRSGFKVCRPQGTFLWPNMSLSTSQHQIDWSAVPTTPSIISSTRPPIQLDLLLSQSPHGLNPGSSSGSLVKPFAERFPVNTSTLSCNVTSPPSLPRAFTRVPSEDVKITSQSQKFKTLQINLNEIPGDAQHNESTSNSRTLTYQRRFQQLKARKENNADAMKDGKSL